VDKEVAMEEFTEDQGVEAIIALQKMGGIVEPEERARKNWNLFSEYDKRNTMNWYDWMCKGGE